MDDQNTPEDDMLDQPTSGPKHAMYKEKLHALVLQISELCAESHITALIHFELDDVELHNGMSSHRVTLLSAPVDTTEVPADILLAAQLLEGMDDEQDRVELARKMARYLLTQGSVKHREDTRTTH